MSTPERTSFVDTVCKKTAKDIFALENIFMSLSWNPSLSVFS